MALPVLPPSERERACGLLERLYDPKNVVYAKGVRIPKTFPAGDLAWLREIGLAPNQRTTAGHDALVRRVVAARRSRSIADGGRIFMASLDADEPPHGAFLEAALLAHRLPAHAFERWGASSSCRQCGLEREVVRDATEEYLDWHRQGSGIPGSVEWAVLALEQWPRRPAPPSKLARGRLASILLALDGLAPGARAGAGVDAVRSLGFFGKSRRDPAARSVVETLAFAGVLEAPPHVGLATRFVSFLERDARPTVRTEYDAPLGFWRGSNGVNWAHAKTLFGLTAASAVQAAELARPAPTPAPMPKRAARVERPRTLPRRPAVAGDVWGVRLREDSWVLVYVWRIERAGARPWALVEYLDWFGESLPEPSFVTSFGVRARSDGRWQMRAHSLEKTTGTVLLAERVPPPKTREPLPDRTPGGSAKELVQLADWCFPELDRL